MLLLTGKAVFISILAGIFLGYFVYPSYVKYQKHDTVFTDSRVNFDPQKPVGITIFAWQKTLLNGWKNNENVVMSLKNLCNESNDYKRVVQCINNRTYTHNDIIEKYTKGLNGEFDMTQETIYVEDISVLLSGKSYSININFEEEDGYLFNIHFNPGQNYSIFIHDPNFYVLAANPKIFPRTFFIMGGGQTNIIYLETTYHSMMDKPN